MCRLDCAVGTASVSIGRIAVITGLEGKFDSVPTNRRAGGDVGCVISRETLGAACGGGACAAVGDGRTVYIHHTSTRPIIEDIAIDAGGTDGS
jgi:hypothetical protein